MKRLVLNYEQMQVEEEIKEQSQGKILVNCTAKYIHVMEQFNIWFTRPENMRGDQSCIFWC